MRAVTRTKYGPPSAVMAVKETAQPEPAANEALVRVKATTVNRTDCGILLGKPFLIKFFTGFPQPRSQVPGTDFAGDVVAVGSDVTDLSVGERVWGFNDNGCASQAQFMVVRDDKPIAKIPEGVSYEAAAASAEGAYYALNFMKRSHYEPGQRVFVYGASGAIGSAAIQLLKAQGSYVAAACGAEQMQAVARLGADELFDYHETEFTDIPGKFDLVFDAVGKRSFAQCRILLTPNGRYVSSELGPHGQNVYLPLTTRLRGGPKVDFPIPSGTKTALDHMNGLLASGQFEPLIDRHFSIDDALAAYEYVLGGQKVGNVILDIVDD